jgi:hypothetical protein
VAGAVLVAHGLLGLLLMSLDGPAPRVGALGLGLGPALLDILLGAALLLGSRRPLSLGFARVGFGLAGLIALHAYRGEPIDAVEQLLLCASLPALLLGNAGRRRMAAALCGAALCLTLEVAGAAVTLTGSNPFGYALMRLTRRIEPEPASEVQGLAYGYRLKLPNGHWYLRTAEAVRQEGSRSDRWLVRPDRAAQVLVIVSQASSGSYDVERLAQRVMDTASAAADDFTLLELQPLGRLPDQGRLIHATATVEGLQTESYYGVFARGNHAVQVIAFVERSRAAGVREELRQIVESFELPPPP